MMPRRNRELKFLRKMTPEIIKNKPETPENIRKLFKPIEDFPLESASSCSEISDVFEEFHRESFFNSKKSKKKNITKTEADFMTMDHFTDDFKSTIAKVRNEMDIPKEMMNESMDDIIQIIKTPKPTQPFPADVCEKIKYVLSEPGEITPPSHKQPAREISNLSYDYMSGVWNMIMSKCGGDDFEISPINYDSNKQDEPHWLEKPEIPKDVLDNSREKCQKWLNEQHN